MNIGFIGQGWIGKNYANDYERRKYEIVRYGLEDEFIGNKDKIAECDIVFIAVPTPTTHEGFDSSIVLEALALIGKGKVAVIKSTMLPGTTDMLQKQYPDIFVFHSPEFLTEKNAVMDARAPKRNIVGIPEFGDEAWNEIAQKHAHSVIDSLPNAPYEDVCTARAAELIKYAGNNFLYTKVLFANILYDLAGAVGADWETVKRGIVADPRIGETHWDPVHQSGHGGVPARGAGGHCFIKDFAAMRELYEKETTDQTGLEMLLAIEKKNKELLSDSGKDLDLLGDVYQDV